MAKPEINSAALDTPCIGVCSTVYGDIICRGCKRNYKDIIEWNAYDQEKRHTVYQQLSALMSKTVSEFIEVLNPSQLQEQLQALHIRSRPFDDMFCLAHHLLRVHSQKIKNIDDYGIAVKAEFQALTLSALFTLIDETLHEKSVKAD